MRRALALTILLVAIIAGSLAADLLTQPPAVTHKVAPVYTAQAARAGIEGTVFLYAEIGVDGRAHRVRVIRGLGYGLDRQAIAAVSQWEFYPGTKDGRAATVPATIEVEFHLAAVPARV